MNQELFERYKKACEFRNVLDEEFVERKITEHYKKLGIKLKSIKKVGSFIAAWDARDAWAAKAAKAAWDAGAAWDAREARAPWDARAAWDAWDAWAAGDARAARAAWDARAPWAAWDASYISASVLGYVDQKDNKFFEIFEAFEKGLWTYWYFDDVFIWLPQPLVKVKDTRCHCDNDAAFILPDEKLYFWKGILVSEKLILHPEQITKEDILNEKNSEVSRAIAEKLGWAEYLKRCDTILIHKWFDPSTCLHYELYDFKKRFELTPRLLKMESPELNDGTRPYYIEPVHQALKTCQAARKWQFAKSDETWPEVSECNSSSDLAFELEA